MYLVPNSRVKIANIMFDSVHNVSITDSVKELNNTAVVTLPRNFKRVDGQGVTDVISKGDRVIIELGYASLLHVEFVGYVSLIGSEAPLVIECEGMWYPHKKNKLESKTFKAATLLQVLQYAFPHYTIDCPEATLGEYIIGKVSSYAVAESLQKSVGFFTRLNESDKTITCYYPFSTAVLTSHFYVFGSRSTAVLEKLRLRNLFPNVKSTKNLKFERKEGSELQIEARSRLRDGKLLTVTVGSTDPDAEKRTRNYGSEKDTVAKLEEAALIDLKLIVYDGYTGSVTGFGAPRVNAGETVSIVDAENPEREGGYLTESIKIKYSVNSGYERECRLSYKI